MPGLSRKVQHSSPVSTSSSSSVSGFCTGDSRPSSIWSRSNTEDVSFAQLQKFWDGLPADDRRKLLRIDKQTLFEQVRKNLYCSRCHGLLVEGFAQIAMYGKSLQAAVHSNAKSGKVFPENELPTLLQDDSRDPLLHPWGGLAATRDNMLTVLDCFLEGMPLEVLQNVFESARGRERERELLYPDACGGNGRGWISQTNVSYNSGRGHGMKETCALHTAKLSCEALVDFWSALSEETRRSLLRMKEEDFIERLMFRFDSKRFCRDCRRNVLREFKEMKELKRSRKEPRCTRWFCAADTSFQYEVSDSAVQADWHDSFSGEVGTLYKYFEWALGTSEGKDDIFGFEDVGLSESIVMEGLELGTFADFFITIRGWRRDGRCNELSVKAHGLKGELCVHRRLFVGDGLVSITEGESIQSFFEHAEETEEEEDEDALDKDGNEIEGEGSSRSQKHAKSPELARDFLLDAATVIFKEQVEKAFREGTARQNAHSVFVSLALGLLEDRVRVACKEIATLEKQNKLLEEEEHEKREEEERRERRKMKEKEKKLRRKEKLKTKEREKDKPKTSRNGHYTEEENKSQCGDDPGDEQSGLTSDITEVQPVPDQSESVEMDHTAASPTQEVRNVRDGHGAFITERSKSAKKRSQVKRQQVYDSRYSRKGKQDPQQCACATAFWMKGCQQSPKSTRKASVLDASSKQSFKTGGSNGRVGGNLRAQNPDSGDMPANGPVLKSRIVCKEGLSYTKVVSRGWTDDDAGKGGCAVEEQTLVNGNSAHVDTEQDTLSDAVVGTAGEVLESVPEPPQEVQPDQQQSQRQQPEDRPDEQPSEQQPEAPLESIPNGDCQPTSGSCKGGAVVEESAEARQAPPVQGRPIQSAPGVHVGAAHSYPILSSLSPIPETGRNGYVNGGFVHAGSHPGAPKSHLAVLDMMAPPGQIRPPVHLHHHQHPRPGPPQAAYGCFPVWAGPPPPPPPPPPHHHHHHHHRHPRGNFIPPPAHGGPPGYFIPGPPPTAAYGYPRYPLPPARVMHHPPPMRIAGDFMPPPPPQPPPSAALPRSVPPASWLRAPPPPAPTSSSSSSTQPTRQTVDCSLQSATLLSDKLLTSSDFSLFHFGGPSTAAATTSGAVTCSTSSGGGSASESGSPTTTGSTRGTACSSLDGDALELVDVVVPEVSSKCMGPLPSGINKASMMGAAGEYSLFAAAPGKGFGFF